MCVLRPVAYFELTPRRSDRLCPASASSDAEFMNRPARPFEIVSATLLPRPDVSCVL